MPDTACPEGDQIEDIEDMVDTNGGTGVSPQERFNSRREVLVRPKKRSGNLVGSTAAAASASCQQDDASHWEEAKVLLLNF